MFLEVAGLVGRGDRAGNTGLIEGDLSLAGSETGEFAASCRAWATAAASSLAGSGTTRSAAAGGFASWPSFSVQAANVSLSGLNSISALGTPSYPGHLAAAEAGDRARRLRQRARGELAWAWSASSLASSSSCSWARARRGARPPHPGWRPGSPGPRRGSCPPRSARPGAGGGRPTASAPAARRGGWPDPARRRWRTAAVRCLAVLVNVDDQVDQRHQRASGQQGQVGGDQAQLGGRALGPGDVGQRLGVLAGQPDPQHRIGRHRGDRADQRDQQQPDAAPACLAGHFGSRPHPLPGEPAAAACSRRAAQPPRRRVRPGQRTDATLSAASAAYRPAHAHQARRAARRPGRPRP